jgi:hypothetical protein
MTEDAAASDLVADREMIHPYAVQIGTGVPATPDHHPGDLPGVGNILQRIPFQQHQFSALAFLDGAKSLCSGSDFAFE